MDSTSGMSVGMSSKETTNYARLCRLLVDAGSRALREAFDKIHPPAKLYSTLSTHPVRAHLESLYKGRRKILNRTQWEKLYPADHSSVSSGNFDTALLMVLLKNISGLKPPDTGWNNVPAANDTSTAADITRLKIFRNKLAHTVEASFDDQPFFELWQNIRLTLIRLGGKRHGPYIDKLRAEDMDPDIQVHYQELLKQLAEDEAVIEQLEGTIAGNSGCVYAQADDISLLDPPVDVKASSSVWTARAALRTVIRSMQFWRKRKPRVSSRDAACRLEATPLKEDEAPDVFCSTNGSNRIPSEIWKTQVEYKVTEKVVTLLEEALNFYLSDHIAQALGKLQDVFQTVSEVEGRYFKTPTQHALRVVSRAKEHFLEDNVSCSVKHGTLLLDSSNSGAQFYISLLNVIGAFAVVISEFRIAEGVFSLLIKLHQLSDVTSRRRDLGAAYNNRGCISLILGDFKQAKDYFEVSLKHLDCEKRHYPNSSSLGTMLISVNCNTARLHLLYRNFPWAMEKQEHLVEECKSKEIQDLPLQVVFTVLNNHAVLCTALGHLNKAEQELKWLISYLYKMNREDCDFLLNFVSLHLSEVLLLHGKSQEAEKASRLETLESADGLELVQMFGGLHINVRIEAFEKLVEVIFLKGKIRFACKLLKTGLQVLTKSFGQDHFNVASLLRKQGTILSRIGEVSIAIEKFKRSIDIFQQIFGVKHPLLLKCYMSLGELTLRLESSDDSYLYFQRAMENIEEIYHVSFVNELFRKYLEITTNPMSFQGRMVWDDTQRIEGLVAEYGLAFVVLLSRPISQDDNSSIRRCEGRKPRITKYTVEIIHLKYTCDFLQSGQKFLRQGMNKEAAAFFQQAEKYSAVYNKTENHADPFLSRFYKMLARKPPGNQKSSVSNSDLTDCLEEIKEATTNVIPEGRSKTPSKDTTLNTPDCRLNLQLVLILLILLSIELKRIDTTFAAYDLYAKLYQNDESFLFFLNGGVQIYASRTSITCNGKTAMQDVLVSSAAGLTGDNSECFTPENQLFRSLACRRNVSSDRFLVTYNSSILLDIEDLQVLESKISLSVQECFRLKCFESAIEGNAITQVAIDLTSNSTSADYDILAAGRRIELLSLCLSEEKSSEVFHKGNISEIYTAMHQKTIRLTFEDEQTSSYMFSKNALSLLEQYNSKQISTLSIKRQCLSMTIAHPVKIRITLWRVEECIKQKIQLVQTAARHDQRGFPVSQPTSCKETVRGLTVADSISWPSIDHWAKTYHLKFLTDDVDSDEPLDISIAPSEQKRIIFDEQHERAVHISSDETEQNEILRKYLNDSVLEGLTVISNLSRQIDDDWTEEDVDIAEVARENAETSPFPSISGSQSQQNISSSFLQASFNPEAETERNNSTLEALHSTIVEDEQCAREENSTSRVDDANELGRSLFEQDRRSRRSIMAEVQEILKEKETLRESNVVNAEQVSQEDRIVATCPNKAEANRTSPITVKSDYSPPRIGNTFTSFEEPAFNPDAVVEAHNSSEPWLHVENTQPTNENASGRQLCEKYRESRSAFDVTFKSQNIVETSQKFNSPEDEKNGKDTPGKQDSVEDLCSDETQNSESCPISGASGRLAQEDGKEKNVETILENFIAKVEVEEAGQFNSHQNTLLKGPRQRTHTATHVEIDRATSDDDVPDGPTNGTSRRTQSNTNHLLPLTDTNFVDRTSERMKNIQIDSEDITENETEMGDLGRRNVGDNCNKALQNGLERNHLKKTTFLHPFRGFMGGDVLTDGDISNASHERKEAFETCQDSSKKVSEDQTTLFQLNVARDVVDAPVCSPQVEPEVKETAPVFGGARPKERSTFTNGSTSTAKTAIAQPTFAYSYNETETRGINPRFQARHTLKSNGAILEASLHDYQDDPFFSAKAMACSETLRAPLERLQPPDYPFDGSSLDQYAVDLYATRTSTQGEVQSGASYRKPTLRQNESWHFPPLETAETTATQSNFHFDQGCASKQHSIPLEDSILPKVEALFNSCESRNAYNEMDSITNDYHSSKENFDNWPVQSSTGIASQQYSTNDNTSSLLGSLKQVMAKTVELITSGNAVGKQPRQETREMEKIGIQEGTREYREEEGAVRSIVENSRNQVESSQENEQVLDTERPPMSTPVQESPRPVCSHYQRRCLVRFPCCGKFYPCHRCHNESEDCSDDQARAINATHIRCTICYHEQPIDEQSQNCGECKSKMSEYFCPTCKHFTSVDKNPFHCDKCGICRIHRDRSFHCDVCNVCLDKRLQGKHKCRPDSGHDECCICLEDAFSGCQILPCSHKVHKDCAIAMIQNGVRTCPICRHPLFSQPLNNSN